MKSPDNVIQKPDKQEILPVKGTHLEKPSIPIFIRPTDKAASAPRLDELDLMSVSSTKIGRNRSILSGRTTHVFCTKNGTDC